MLWSDVLDLTFKLFVIGLLSGLFLGIVARLLRWAVDIINQFTK